ncbi:assimilatory sulfite reductase (NADPH) flavoprotein subunit [Shewanella sp. 202IG2-18]|uniref:assimilatory sulfite reductase (NADPH) flavoprotein subunit n=1 Tax=Parashewanella hymeniacidonis TaxID=2807618 RepID=UPI0019610189|nr:assimilatory sulfite reductase (NADPH) flavoprotein subunit [Parashewanella hymeniacidonis]
MVLDSVLTSASPLTAKQLESLTGLTTDLTPIQKAWLSGYFAGQLKSDLSLPANESVEPAAVIKLLYGSQTGNGRSIAEKTAATYQAQGLNVELVSMADYSPRQLKNESHIVIIVSTHGEGEAPDDAVALYQFLHSKRAPKLPELKFSVLALGDSSYEFFCQTGKDFSKRLLELGAQEFVPLAECDVDYEETAASWSQTLAIELEKTVTKTAQVLPLNTSATTIQASGFTKENPFSAEIIVSQKLTGRDSDRDVRHVEIDLAGSGMTYQVGDALGVWFKNQQSLVNEIIIALGFSHDEAVGDNTLQHILTEEKELTQLTPSVVSAWAEYAQNEKLNKLIKNKEQLRDYITHHQVIELISQYPASVTAEQFVNVLRPLTPRLYSIASSQDEVDEEVHLTVAKVVDERQGTLRLGAASRFLSESEEGQTVKVYVEPNSHFRLPDDPATAIIMVGPGTGVAPFRAFLQQRSTETITGDSWLFFGNPNFEQDFLYQTEWQQFLKKGVLSRLDVAFSRDQAKKVYVQHRLLERGEAVWQWLQTGAHLYICGDAKRMAKDVHQALLAIAQQHGGLDTEQAEAFYNELRINKRYQKDVY